MVMEDESQNMSVRPFDTGPWSATRSRANKKSLPNCETVPAISTRPQLPIPVSSQRKRGSINHATDEGVPVGKNLNSSGISETSTAYEPVPADDNMNSSSISETSTAVEPLPVEGGVLLADISKSSSAYERAFVNDPVAYAHFKERRAAIQRATAKDKDPFADISNPIAEHEQALARLIKKPSHANGIDAANEKSSVNGGVSPSAIDETATKANTNRGVFSEFYPDSKGYTWTPSRIYPDRDLESHRQRMALLTTFQHHVRTANMAGSTTEESAPEGNGLNSKSETGERPERRNSA